MATTTELRIAQKRTLFELLKLRKDNVNVVIVGLDVLIAKFEAEMEAEDVAYVEKKVENL